MTKSTDTNAHKPRPLLILIRGLPGSGKSTIAKKAFGDFIHYEADMFFMKDGEYKWEPSNIKDAHTWCYQATKKALLAGKDVVVANTFVKREHIQPYRDLAKECDTFFAIIEASGKFQNVHNVPQAAIERMASQWEDVIDAIPY